jgi:hypothetical protein
VLHSCLSSSLQHDCDVHVHRQSAPSPEPTLRDGDGDAPLARGLFDVDVDLVAVRLFVTGVPFSSGVIDGDAGAAEADRDGDAPAVAARGDTLATGVPVFAGDTSLADDVTSADRDASGVTVVVSTTVDGTRVGVGVGSAGVGAGSLDGSGPPPPALTVLAEAAGVVDGNTDGAGAGDGSPSGDGSGDTDGVEDPAFGVGAVVSLMSSERSMRASGLNADVWCSCKSHATRT